MPKAPMLESAEHVCEGTDGDYEVCIDGQVYGYCDDEDCSGACDHKGRCNCSCHGKKKESNA